MQVWASRSGGSRQIVLAVVLSSVLAMVGCSTSNSGSSGDNATAAPTFKPGAGTYNSAQTVTIADTTPGAVLYCTTDGTTPTTSSPQCSQPTTIYKTEFLQAIAVAPGKAQSTVGSAAYTINFNAAATPTFTPAGGAYTGAQKITINDATTGANIYYTLDGTVPSSSSTLYTGPITISTSSTLSAIAVASGYANSGVMSAQYAISSGTQSPMISPAGGTFGAAQNITITDATPGATIYYTVDGSTPTPNSAVYSSPIAVSANATVSAIAIASGVSSTVTTATFVINVPVAAAPTFSPAAGSYMSAQQVTLSSTTQGATIYYTVDNSTPTTSSPQYTGAPINVAATETIKAIATAPGFSASAVSSSTYTITSTTAAPTFSPVAGTYTSAQQVTLSSATPSATIYYTVDGNPPTTNSTQYSSPINVTATETINTIAVAGGNTSTVASATYTINVGPSYGGKVVSGTQPVVGASVQMYAAGQSGYGSSATLLTSTAATTGLDGSFTLNYSCPAAPADLVYLVATGGHVGSSGSNAGLAFMAALGSCNGALPNPLVVNEVTSVASAYALAQFMTGTANVGSSLANYQQGTNTAPGLAHAFATVTNLVDLTTGQARDHTPAYPTNLTNDTSVLNNSTVPQARINTLANTLNACATDNSKCSGLFSAATPPPPGTAPSDTLQAILDIAQNPGNQASAVYGVASGSGPFTPVLSAAPNDWTLALTFTGGGLGFARSAPIKALASTASSFTNGVFENTSLAIDATGNLWITGFTVRASNTSLALYYDLFSGMVAKFDNLGNPLTQPSSLASDGTPTYGGFVAINQYISGQVANSGTLAPRSIGIDPSGNAWVTGGSKATLVGGGTGTTAGGAMTEITPGLTPAIPWINLGTSLSNAPIAIDGGGDVWTFDVNMQKFDNTGTLQFSNDGTGTPGNTSGYASSNVSSLIFGANATSLWASGYGGGHFFQISPADGSGLADYSALSNDGVFTNIAADNSGNIYGCRLTPGQELDVFNASNTTSSIASYPISTTRGCGGQMVMDGAGHLFTITGSPGSTITPGIIDEFSITSSGITAITPGSGYTGTGSGETPTINGDPSAPRFVSVYPYPAVNRGIAGAAIDGSGNLWVLNVDTGTAASTGNVLVEFVGIAAPVVTPTSLALQYGQVGVRP